jgi:beta-lactamase superfamily II metal-dependent hydrolase
MSENLNIATSAQAGYKFMRELVTPVYDKKKSPGMRRKLQAKLLVGDWVKLENDDGTEAEIKCRGGAGYVPSDSLGDSRLLEIYYIDVGQGDSILIQTPDDKRILIDGGKTNNAYSFIKWKYRLDHYFKDFEAIIISHGDEDHSKGLISLFKDPHVYVRRFIHNGLLKRSSRSQPLGATKQVGNKKMLTEIFDDVTTFQNRNGLTPLYKELVEAIEIAKERTLAAGIPSECTHVDNLSDPLVIGTQKPVKINFVNPVNQGTKANPEVRWFSDARRTINGNSVGTLIEYGKLRVLMCGDMNRSAENEFIRHWGDSSPHAHVFKANHHGSSDFSEKFMRRIQPWITVISSGDEPDYGHPRANLLGAVGRYASNTAEMPLVFSTEIAATFKSVEVSSLATGARLYEKSIFGMINIRSNGEWVAGGRVYKRGSTNRRVWDWERYAYDLATGDFLDNDLTP